MEFIGIINIRKGILLLPKRALKVLNENKEQCRKCGGVCCKKAPGLYFPEDLGASREEIISTLLEMLQKREVYIISNFGGLVVRPEQKQKNIANIGPCIWHTETGCAAPIKPAQCSALVPGGTWYNPSCSSPTGFTEKEAVVSWSFMTKDLKVLRDIYYEYG